jgi:hypothetical protein
MPHICNFLYFFILQRDFLADSLGSAKHHLGNTDLDYWVSNGRNSHWWWKGKDLEGSASGLINTLSWQLLEGLTNTMERTSVFTSVLDEGECSASRLGRFTPEKKAPCIHCIEGWVGPRAGLDAVVKHPFPLPGIEPRTLNLWILILFYTKELHWTLLAYPSVKIQQK